jgi:hypothetical protein
MIREDYVPYMGEWAELRKNYLLEEKPEDFQELVESKLLLEYFEGIEEMYNNKFDELVEEQMEREGIDEELKSRDPLEWVGYVNNIRSQVREILTAEICS